MHSLIRSVAVALLFPILNAHAQNALLRQLAKEDQASRTGTDVTRTDKERVRLVLEAVGSGKVKTPEDKFNAALVLDHTGMTFCGKKLVSVSPNRIPPRGAGRHVTIRYSGPTNPPPLYSVYNPSGDNSVVCTDFMVTAGQLIVFNIDNKPPPGGMGLTIGFWKNWCS